MIDLSSKRLAVDLVSAADARIALARHPNAGAALPVSMALLREAGALLLRALAVDSGHAVPLEPGAAWRTLGDLAPAVVCPPELATLLTDPDPMVFERVATPVALRQSLDDLVSELRALLEIRPPRVRRLEGARQVLVGVVLGGALLFAGGRQLFTPRDVARGKRVSTATAPEGAASHPLVDGEIHHPFAAVGAWVQVDLQAEHVVSSIRVLHRRDCCFNENLPYLLELSLDGKTWTVLARKTGEFLPNDAWNVRGRDAHARYVRVRAEMPGTLVALSSLEVRGKPVK